MHIKISHPAQLETLSADELFASVRPLLRTGGLTANPGRLARIRPNVSSVCFELGANWTAAPFLNGRRVDFEEYLAVLLCRQLHTLDRQQHPHLYPDGRFLPTGQPLALDYGYGVAGPASYPSLDSGWRDNIE